ICRERYNLILFSNNVAKVGIRKYILLRVRLAFLFVSLLALLIIYKVMNIQLVEGERWASRARGVEMRDVQPTRGSILADDGSLLATSLPFYRVAIDPTVVDSALFYQNIDTLGQLLATFFKEHDAKYYIDLLKEDRRKARKYRILSKKIIDYEQ
ncbi:MAG: hypothetical protein CUN55_18695, partial [Phototrophicales bacterium]